MKYLAGATEMQRIGKRDKELELMCIQSPAHSIEPNPSILHILQS